MNGISGIRILFITCQLSMVVSGLESKLKEKGSQVITVRDDDPNLAGYMRAADVFLYYLPTDIFDEQESMVIHNFLRVMDILNDKKLILMGENRNHNQYLKEVPAIGEKVWLDRPIDYSRLEDEIFLLFYSEEAEQLKGRILIVDDDPAYAKMVRSWIKDMYTVDIVTAGMQAIKFLVKNKVDLILLDYEMPVVDGPQVLEMIRSEPGLSDLPVVFLTGINSRESIQRVLSLKPAGYILKNNTREELINTLMDLFAKIK